MNSSNATCRSSAEDTADVVRVCYFILLPIISFSGILGNSLVIFVLTKGPGRGSERPVITYCLLCKVSWDLVTLLCAPAVFTMTYFVPHVFYPILPLSFGLVHTCRTAGIFTAAAIAVERFLAVWKPFTHQRVYTRRRVQALMGALSLSSIVYCIPKFVEFRVERSQCATWQLRPGNHRLSPYYQNLYIFLFHFVFLFAVPFGLILVLNVFIYVSVKRSKRQSICANSNANLRRDKSTTVMLLAEAVLFLLFNTVSLFLNAVESLAPASFQTYTLRFTMPVIGNVLTFASCANNLPVFYLFGSAFRQRFRQTLGGASFEWLSSVAANNSVASVAARRRPTPQLCGYTPANSHETVRSSRLGSFLVLPEANDQATYV